MIWLVAGVALWWAAHLFKRMAPKRRVGMGEKGKGLVAGALLVSVVLMVIGYRSATGPYWWGRTPALTGINNLMVLFAFYLFAASGMKTRITRYIRHPQLTAIILWSAGHLLVNGDLPSVILFGGLFVWALVEMVVINASERTWTRPAPAPLSKEVQAIIGGLIVFAVVAAIHTWIGYPTFG